MAFIGLSVIITGVIIAAVFAFVFFGVLPIVAGTILIKREKYKKIGVALRIFGYFTAVPTVLFILIFIAIAVIK